MEETQNFKEGLLNLANNLDSSNGVILITGINSGTSEKIDVNYHELIPQLALPALLSTVASVYESVLNLYDRGLERGDFTEDEVKKWNSINDNMFNEFNSIKNDLAEKSFVKRTQIIKELEKEN